MFIYNKMYVDSKIKKSSKIVKKIVENDFDKKYYILLFNIDNNELLDIICTSHLKKLHNYNSLTLVGIAKTKETAIKQSVQFIEDILAIETDLLNFNFNSYITSNSSEE